MKKMLGLGLIMIAGLLTGCDDSNVYESMSINEFTHWLADSANLNVVPSAPDDRCMRQQLYRIAFDIHAVSKETKKTLLDTVKAANIKYISLRPTEKTDKVFKRVEYKEMDGRTLYWWEPFDPDQNQQSLPKTDISFNVKDRVLSVTTKSVRIRKDWYLNRKGKELCMDVDVRHHGEEEVCAIRDSRKTYDKLMNNSSYENVMEIMQKSTEKGDTEWSMENQEACGQVVNLADAIDVLRNSAAEKASADAGTKAKLFSKQLDEQGIASLGAP